MMKNWRKVHFCPLLRDGVKHDMCQVFRNTFLVIAAKFPKHALFFRPGTHHRRHGGPGAGGGPALPRAAARRGA